MPGLREIDSSEVFPRLAPAFSKFSDLIPVADLVTIGFVIWVGHYAAMAARYGGLCFPKYFQRGVALATFSAEGQLPIQPQFRDTREGIFETKLQLYRGQMGLP